jgi:hypothetical protein
MKMADQASNMNVKANSAQASIETFNKNESAQNVEVKSEPEMKLEEPLSTLPSTLEPQANIEDFNIQPPSMPQRSSSMAASRSESIAMNQESTTHVSAPDAQVKAEKEGVNSETGFLKPDTRATTATKSSPATSSAHSSTASTQSIMQPYSELITELLSHITNLETLQTNILEETSLLITTTKSQQQEIQTLKLALAINEQNEAEKVIVDVTEEMKIKCDEAELRNIELMIEKARLEKENKGLKEMVKRFEKLYGGIEEAEELDG